MIKKKIFISSNQLDFGKERREIKNFIKNDPLYNNYFEVFIFEDTPANGISPQKIYLDKVRDSDIFIGLIGENYGNKNENGISATEEEFNEFTKGQNKSNTYMFILENIKKDKSTEKFIEKAKNFTYSKFTRTNFEKKIKKSLSTDYQFLTSIYFTKTIFCRRRNGIFQFQNGIKIDFRGKKW